MTQAARIPQYRRLIAGVLAVLLGLGPLATPAYAAVTALSDQPLNAQSQAKPDIMLTVDDSTSMLFDFLPDTVVGKYCRDWSGSMNANCGISGQNTDLTAQSRGKYVTPGFVFEQYGMPYPAYNAAFDASGPGAGCLFVPLGARPAPAAFPPVRCPGSTFIRIPPGRRRPNRPRPDSSTNTGRCGRRRLTTASSTTSITTRGRNTIRRLPRTARRIRR